MLFLLCIILLIAAFWAFKKVSKKDRVLIIVYTVLSAIFVATCVNVLFVLNVEAIHFIQYAVFAIICFQITKSYWRTMFWSILAGAVDELYQYVYLAPTQSEYYDFNDVVINTVGAGLGLVLIRVLNPPAKAFSLKSSLISVESVTTLGIFIFVTIGLVVGFISYGPNPDALFCFMKAENIDFWYTVKTGPKVMFHVVKPIEGILLVLFLAVIYSFLEKDSNSIDQSLSH